MRSLVILIIYLFITLPDRSTSIKFGSLGPQLPISEIPSFPDPRGFFLRHVFPQRAVVVRGGGRVSPALTLWQSDDHLRDRARQAKAQGENTTVAVEVKKKEDRNAPQYEIDLEDFLSRYGTEDVYLVDELPWYLAEDVVLPRPLQCPGLVENSLLTAQTWFSSGGTKSVIHTDDAENLLCVYSGRKEVVVIDPHRFYHHVGMDTSIGASWMDVDDVDVGKFPRLAEVEHLRANLSAGDCLYIPYRWIHQVRSYERNIGVNIWWNHHDNKHLDLNLCSAENLNFDPTLTLDKVIFHGFHHQLRNVDAVSSVISDLMSGIGTIASPEHIFTFFVDNPEELSLAEVNALESLTKMMFVKLDADGDGEIREKEVKQVEPQQWEEIQKILLTLQYMGGELLGDFNDLLLHDFLPPNERDEL